VVKAKTIRSAVWLLAAAAVTATAAPEAGRQKELVRLVRQDCGSCHGMTLLGGLGPALTPAALKDKPAEGLSATILGGRPGTPMPPWKTFLTEAEADWIVQQLLTGFPQ
jgi:cytochrome c55X